MIASQGTGHVPCQPVLGVPIEAQAELAPGGLDDADALRHDFFADSVARDCGDSIVSQRSLPSFEGQDNESNDAYLTGS